MRHVKVVRIYCRERIEVYLFAILTLLLCCLAGAASAREYHFRGLTIADGLSDMLVNRIYEDSEGMMWFGSHNSIDRFDGYNIESFSFECDSLNPNIKISRINDIVETPSGQLYVANNIGLWELKKEEGRLVRLFADRINELVLSLHFSDGVGLMVGAESGLYIVNNGEINQIKIEEDLFSYYNSIKDIFVDSDQMIWVATQRALSSIDPNNDFAVKTFKDQSGAVNSIHSFVKIDGKIYLGTLNDGLFCFDTKSASYAPYIDVGCAKITALNSDSEGDLYVATDGGGVHKVSTQGDRIVQSFNYSPNDKGSIRSNAAYSLLIDKRDELWIGYYQAGVDYTLHQSDMFQISDLSGLLDTQNISVRSFAEHENWIVVGAQDGLYLVDKKSGKIAEYHNQIESNAVLSILFHDGLFYIGCYGSGLRVLDPSTKQLHGFPIANPIFTKGIVYSLCTDKNNHLWIATSGGVFCYEAKSRSVVHKFTMHNSPLPSNMVYRVFFDSEGKGWLATKNGMVLYDPKTQRVRTELFPKEFVNEEAVRYIYEDSHQNLYFLPDRGGIYRSNLDMSQCRRVDPSLGIHSDKFSFVIEDAGGYIWVGSDNGLIRTTEGWDNFSHFGFSDGITESIFPIGAAYVGDEGDMYIASPRGVLSHRAQSEAMTSHEYRPIKITSTKVNGQEYKNFANARLSTTQNHIEFNFSALTYTKPQSELFEILLEGRDTEWEILSGDNRASYFNLASGEYRFRVRRMGEQQSEASVEFSIGLSLSYILFCLAIIITLIFSVVSCVIVVRERRRHQEAEKSKRYSNIKISDEECEKLLARLNLYMAEQRPYIDANLKITDLAKALNTSSSTLSYTLNQHLKVGYNGYVNEFRIARFKELVIDEKYSKYTLVAICELCGFSSRATFFRAFKKSVGVTPTEYIESLKK
ncbi:MAG: two-component regulator propeller domain-containing protein [Rikenellaceae bacterium]